jgi:hypothetical protein
MYNEIAIAITIVYPFAIQRGWCAARLLSFLSDGIQFGLKQVILSTVFELFCLMFK